MAELGFGFLRLPMVGEGQEKQVDLEAGKALVDRFLDAGGRYFDTAYTYLDGGSEAALRQCLVERYPRDRYILTDKIPSWKPVSMEDCGRYYEEMRARCGVEYFDRVLLHWLNADHYDACRKNGGFEFLRALKADGKVKEIGFSFHDTADVLDAILTDHPEVDCVLLQINYLDWENPAVQSRACYETAVRHNRKILVMEPVKGGTLAQVPPEAQALMEAAAPGRSPAQWAISFVRSLPGVEIVLSGMNQPAQIDANMAAPREMTEGELEVLAKVRAILQAEKAIPCTGCRYCTSGCPKGIVIPDYFKLYNALQRSPGDGWKIRPAFEGLKRQAGAPADCIGCGACQRSCPQHLPIIDLLAQAGAALGK